MQRHTANKEIYQFGGADKGMQRANFQQRFFWSNFFFALANAWH